MYQEIGDSRARRVHLYFYAICQLIAGIVVIIAASLYWFKYCFFYFGLYKVTDIISNFDLGIDNISDVQDDCDGITFEDDDYIYYIDPEDLCEDFCDKVDDVKKASDAMIVLTSLTLLLLLINIVLVLVRLCKQDFRPKLFPVMIGGLSSLLYLLGFIIYMATSDFNSFEDCEDTDICDDFAVHGGIILSGVIMFIMILIQIYGFICTRKAYFS